MPYRTAVFDLDGTLLDTLEDLYLATNAALEHYSLPRRTRDEVRMFVGNGVELLIRRAVPSGTDEQMIQEVLADFKATYATICEDHTEPYKGVLDLLTALRAHGIRTAVVSNKFDAATKRLCGKYFGDLVEVAIGEKAGVRKKPAPDTVMEALNELGVTADRAVYVGDSDVDIQTAKNCSMPCISVTWGLRDEDFLRDHGATTLIHSPEELLPIIIT
ncbi:MAG: HAD family hydrolase [Clostridia bacterium]|nr:HAD family hydrolase [Clostridia bacterium]